LEPFAAGCCTDSGPACPCFTRERPRSADGRAPAGDGRVEGGWYYAKVLWVASPAHPGPFLVQGRQLDGPRRLRFGEGPQPAAELLLPAGGTAHSQDSDWFNWPSYSRLRGGGCYAYQVDSANRHPDHRLPGMTPPRPLCRA
jgi:hypothetical protein